MRQLITLAKPIVLQLKRPVQDVSYFPIQTEIIRIVRSDVCTKLTGDRRKFVEVTVDGLIPLGAEQHSLWDLVTENFGGAQTIEIEAKQIRAVAPAEPQGNGGVYLELFHGRTDPSQEMDDQGEPGPVFGPFPFFHMTYASDIKFGDEGYRLSVTSDHLVYYGGKYYGDWSMFSALSDDTRERVQSFEQEKAAVTQ